MVAAQTDDVSFFIAVSCPAQTADEQSEYRPRWQALDEGGSAEAAERRVDEHRPEARGGAAARSAAGRLLGPPAGEPLAGSDEAGRSVGRAEDDGSFLLDPPPWLGRLRCPVLALFGANDHNVGRAGLPADLPGGSAGSLGRGPAAARFALFAGADPLLFVSPSGTMREWREHLRRGDLPFGEGYLETMTEWLRGLPAPLPAGQRGP